VSVLKKKRKKEKSLLKEYTLKLQGRDIKYNNDLFKLLEKWNKNLKTKTVKSLKRLI